jgi:hypothetical protein
MTGNWRDPSTISALEGYLRLAVGTAFAVILLAMLASGKIDPSGFIKAILSVLALDRGANGILAILRAKQQRGIE